jgi:predicted peptidase
LRPNFATLAPPKPTLHFAITAAEVAAEKAVLSVLLVEVEAAAEAVIGVAVEAAVEVLAEMLSEARTLVEVTVETGVAAVQTVVNGKEARTIAKVLVARPAAAAIAAAEAWTLR